MSAAEKTEQVVIPAMDLREATITLEGVTPFLAHAWSEKAKRMMRDSQMKKGRQAKAARDPEADYRDSIYYVSREPEIHGMPIVAIKAAAAASWAMVDSLKKAAIRGSFHLVNGEPTDQGDLVELRYGSVRMREDMVRLALGAADLRYRAEYREWSVEVVARFNARAISIEQLCNVLDVAGFAVGVGEWRPAKGGTHGQFRVANIR